MINAPSQDCKRKANLVNKALFLDRDGVINRKLEGDYIKSWDEFRFLPGVFEAIKAIKEKGYLVIVVTNQRGIARGFMTEKDLEEIHRKMLKELERHGAQVDDIFYCPHDLSDNCNVGNLSRVCLFRSRRNGISILLSRISSAIQIVILKPVSELDVVGFWRQI